jgi:hypothetical protein
VIRPVPVLLGWLWIALVVIASVLTTVWAAVILGTVLWLIIASSPARRYSGLRMWAIRFSSAIGLPMGIAWGAIMLWVSGDALAWLAQEFSTGRLFPPR